MKPDIEKLRRSGLISATAREEGRKMIVPGAKLEDIACAAEAIIRDMGGEPAFPAQLSVNHIAAHYCSPIDDPLTIGPGDIVKLDQGTHVDGYVTDNAVTVDLRGGPEISPERRSFSMSAPFLPIFSATRAAWPSAGP